jgi:hypothetical protein
MTRGRLPAILASESHGLIISSRISASPSFPTSLPPPPPFPPVPGPSELRHSCLTTGTIAQWQSHCPAHGPPESGAATEPGPSGTRRGAAGLISTRPERAPLRDPALTPFPTPQPLPRSESAQRAPICNQPCASTSHGCATALLAPSLLRHPLEASPPQTSAPPLSGRSSQNLDPRARRPFRCLDAHYGWACKARVQPVQPWVRLGRRGTARTLEKNILE